MHFKHLAYFPCSLALAACIVSKPVGEDPTEGATESATTESATTEGATTEGATTEGATTGPDDPSATGPSATDPGETDPSETGPAPNACPVNGAFFCSEPYACPDDSDFCGGLFSAFDATGCLRKACGSDGDCAADEVCFTAVDWGGCVGSSFECEDFERGECVCSSDANCDGSYCVPKTEAPPALCPEITEEAACIAAGCSAFEQGGVLTLDGDTCTTAPSDPFCLWFVGGEAGGAATPAAFYNLGTGEVSVFGTDYVTPPLGWGSCSDPSAPAACACFEG